MSGHSHYATIKRQKESKDAQKGKIFSKLAKEISIAVKAGGGPDPISNFKLRVAVERARAANLPKDNIDRAISKGAGEGTIYEEVTYEGFGPSGIGVLVEAATDNRNRTGQEVKNVFESGGGSLAGPGAVSFNFEQKGLILVTKEENTEEQMLKLIDAQVEDIEETDDAIEVYTQPDKLSATKDSLQELGFKVISFELLKKPKSLQTMNDSSVAQKALQLLDSLNNLEDVQKVYANIDIPDAVLSEIKT